MRKKRNKLTEKVPLDFNSSLPVLEFSGNRRVVLEGSTGVVRYSDNVVIINTRMSPVTFKGRGLSINCISTTCVIIEGFILSVEFVN